MYYLVLLSWYLYCLIFYWSIAYWRARHNKSATLKVTETHGYGTLWLTNHNFILVLCTCEMHMSLLLFLILFYLYYVGLRKEKKHLNILLASKHLPLLIPVIRRNRGFFIAQVNFCPVRSLVIMDGSLSCSFIHSCFNSTFYMWSSSHDDHVPHIFIPFPFIFPSPEDNMTTVWMLIHTFTSTRLLPKIFSRVPIYTCYLSCTERSIICIIGSVG